MRPGRWANMETTTRKGQAPKLVITKEVKLTNLLKTLQSDANLLVLSADKGDTTEAINKLGH